MIHMEEKLLDLFARLSRSSARSKVYAGRAKKDNRPDLARLFLAIADSQAMQAQRFLMQIRGTIEATDANERSVFDVELPKAIEDYTQLMAEAEQEGFKALATGFRHSAKVDRQSLQLHDRMHEQTPETEYSVCDFCGYLTTGKPPDHCPVCTAPKNRFKKVDAG